MENDASSKTVEGAKPGVPWLQWVVVPLVLVAVSSLVTWHIATEDRQSEFLGLALQELEGDEELHKWAARLLESSSPLPVPQELMEELTAVKPSKEMRAKLWKSMWRLYYAHGFRDLLKIPGVIDWIDEMIDRRFDEETLSFYYLGISEEFMERFVDYK